MSTLDTNRTQFEAALADLLAQYGVGSGTTILPERLSLVNYTKIKLDEIIPEGEGVQFSIENDVNTSDPLSLMVDAILNEAAKRTLLHAPLHILTPYKSDVSAVADSEDSAIGTITLPDDFLRFVSLKMADWKRPVTKAIGIEDERYILQSNEFTRGGTVKPVVVIKTQPLGYGSAVKQVDTITLTGEDSANIAVIQCAGMEQMCTWGATLSETASAFVADNSSDYLKVGVVLSYSGANIIFTAVTAGTPFVHATIEKYDGDDAGGIVTYTTPNVSANVFYRVLEYYSVISSHAIDYLLYIPETSAQDIQSNLVDALTWNAAGIILQITERHDLSGFAFEQEELSYTRL